MISKYSLIEINNWDFILNLIYFIIKVSKLNTIQIYLILYEDIFF
jgi:hypothetical protein